MTAPLTHCKYTPEQTDNAWASPDEAQVAVLLQDRMACIAPVLRADLRASLDLATPSPKHQDVLRRNVAAHPRAHGRDPHWTRKLPLRANGPQTSARELAACKPASAEAPAVLSRTLRASEEAGRRDAAREELRDLQACGLRVIMP